MVPDEWYPFLTVIYTYDDTDEYVTGSLMIMNMGTSLNPMRRATYSYDSQHRLTWMLVEHNTGLVTPVWSTEYWVKIQYVTNTNFAVYNYSAAGSQDPQRWNRSSFTWDAQGRITTETTQVSQDSVNWTNDYYMLHTYHPNDTTTGDTFVQNVAHWLPFELMETNFWFNGVGTMFGMVSMDTEQYWSGISWTNDVQHLYTYNTSNKLIDMVEKSWNDNFVTWDNYQRETDSYYDNDNLRYQTKYEWNTMNLEWDDRYKYTCTWGQVTGSADETAPPVTDLVINVSPNPFRSQTRISIRSAAAGPASIQIYNLVGQLVKSLSLSKNSTYTWDGNDKNGTPVSAGIYFLKADDGVKTHTVKLLKVE
jgi:YD repeat-containing protein